MLARLYSLLWLLLKLFATGYGIIRWLCWRFNAVKLWSYDQNRNKTAITHSDRIVLEQCKQLIGKLPRHLNIIVGPTDTQMDAAVFTRLLIYASIMGVDCVSLYDTRSEGGGYISLDRMQTPKDVFLKKLQKHKFQCRIGSNVALQLNGKLKTELNGIGITNGTAQTSNTAKSFEVYEIKPHHNRPLLAAVCRDLFERQHSIESQEALTQCITKNLSSRLCEMPDPELSLIFNRDMCTFGLLPWHASFTEFHIHMPGRCFDAASFVQILYKYARCEQRWGK